MRLGASWGALGASRRSTHPQEAAVVVGCAMFAPDDLRKRDLPGLVARMNEAELALGEELQDAGIV